MYIAHRFLICQGENSSTMTIKIPEPNLADKILALFGKKRAIRIPTEIYDTHGPYAYGMAKRESFISALIRPKNQKVPDGWFYPDKD